MPALSPTMTSGNIGEWRKNIGDEVVPGDVLVEIETDKAQMDFECQEEGFLAKILVNSGAKEVPINSVSIGYRLFSKVDTSLIDKIISFSQSVSWQNPKTM